MVKYKDEKDFIQREFISKFDPDIVKTELSEDDKNYYISAKVGDREFKKFITFYKDKIQEAIQVYETSNEEDMGNLVEIDPETGNTIVKE